MERIGQMRHKGMTLNINRATYANNGRTAVEAFEEDGQPYAHLSVNVAEVELGPDEFVVPDYRLPDDLLDALETSPLFRDTGRRVNFGHVRNAPVFAVAAVPAS